MIDLFLFVAIDEKLNQMFSGVLPKWRRVLQKETDNGERKGIKGFIIKIQNRKYFVFIYG